MSPLWSNTTNRPDLWVGSCLKSPYPELVWGRRHSSHPPQNTIKQESLRTPALGVHVQVLAAGPAEAASVRRGWAQTPSDKMAPHGAPVLRKGGKHCLGSKEKTFVPLRAPEKVEESFFFPDRPKWLPSTELIPDKEARLQYTQRGDKLQLPPATAKLYCSLLSLRIWSGDALHQENVTEVTHRVPVERQQCQRVPG